jgi:hypothetical protein
VNIPVPTAPDYVQAIKASGLSIYDAAAPGSPLYIPSPELEALLDSGLRGFSVVGLPLRTRSKIVKLRICEILGYPVPASFKRTKPLARFPCQNFDTYVQTSDNLQVWNESLSATRRYVLIREEAGALTRVRVVTGADLAVLDTTGTLTQKYQARFAAPKDSSELISPLDTERLRPAIATRFPRTLKVEPTAHPDARQILPIAELWRRLRKLIGQKFPDAGADQERNRGAALHRLACVALGYETYADDGRFPDVKHQLLEVKLQTAPTIDLGLVTPDSSEPLDLHAITPEPLRHQDVRYALFSASTDGKTVTLRGLHLTTGADFFTRFPRFGGKILNRKLQLRLPKGYL